MTDWRKEWERITHRDVQQQEEVIKFISSIEGNPRVLDLACGSGNVVSICRRIGHRAVGLDFSSHCRVFCIALQVPFVQADMLALPFKNKIFDVTLCLRSLNYIESKRELEVFVKDVDRVTNGFIILSFSDAFKIELLIRAANDSASWEILRGPVRVSNTDAKMYVFRN